MKNLYKCFLIGMIVLSLFSCREEDDIQSSFNEDKGILLEIAENSNSYINKDGDYFYSDAFVSKNDTNLYRLSVKSGIKYSLTCVQPDQMYSNVEMILLNSDLDTITYSESYTGLARLFFNSNFEDELYLIVYLKGNYNESLTYNLYFENTEFQSFDILGANWKYSGNWNMIDNKSVQLKKSDSRKFRWMRLEESLDISERISFTLKSSDTNVLPSFGVVLGGSYQLLYWGDYKEELPQYGTFFNIMNNQRYRVMNLHGDGISFSYGELDIQNINMRDGVKFDIDYHFDSGYKRYAISLNDVPVKGFTISALEHIYLVVEDNGFDTLILDDLKIE